MENNQREITHKILKPELWFLCMTHRLIMLNLNGFHVIERTRNCIENNQREITPKTLAHDTSSHRDLQVYQASLKNL